MIEINCSHVIHKDIEIMTDVKDPNFNDPYLIVGIGAIH